MSGEMHPLHQAYMDALAEGSPMAFLPVGRTVLCDDCDKNYTDDPVSGGILFQSKAIGPCCAERWEASAVSYGEERFIRGRCPDGASFADWVRGMRHPDAAITVSAWMPGGEQ